MYVYMCVPICPNSSSSNFFVQGSRDFAQFAEIFRSKPLQDAAGAGAAAANLTSLRRCGEHNMCVTTDIQ